MLPVTVASNGVVTGYQPEKLKKLLSIGADIPRELTAPELLEKYRLVFAACRRAVEQIPEDQLDWKTPANERRGQTLRATAWHLFDRPDVCLDASRVRTFSFEQIHQYERNAEQYRTIRDILDYGDTILKRLEDFLTNHPEKLDIMVDAYLGPRTVGQLLNLTLSGTLMRLRQTYHFLRAVGVEPKDTFREEDFAGIVIPKKLFG